MLGFCQYSPAVLSLLVDRDRYRPLIITNVLPASLKKLAEFLDFPEVRAKVVMFASVEILLDIIDEGFNLQTSKIVVVDTISNLFKVTDNIQDVRKRGNSFQFLSIVPAELNESLEECTLGAELKEGLPVVLEEMSLKTKVVQRNLNNEAELNMLIEEVVSHLGNKEKAEATEGLLKFVAGISSKKRLGATCRAFTLQTETLQKIVDYTNSYKGKALRVAFMDACLYKTDPDIAMQEAKASRLDFDYLTTLLPTDGGYMFDVKPPKVLSKKRLMSGEEPIPTLNLEETDEGARPHPLELA